MHKINKIYPTIYLSNWSHCLLCSNLLDGDSGGPDGFGGWPVLGWGWGGAGAGGGAVCILVFFQRSVPKGELLSTVPVSKWRASFIDFFLPLGFCLVRSAKGRLPTNVSQRWLCGSAARWLPEWSLRVSAALVESASCTRCGRGGVRGTSSGRTSHTESMVEMVPARAGVSHVDALIGCFLYVP